MKIAQHPSPNFGERRDGQIPDLIVIHYTAMATAGAALERLCDPEFEVSAHYLICAQGAVTQMVPEDQRAWHAGAGAWGASTDINSRSIGIELANDGSSPFAAAQMDALEALLGAIIERWAIPLERVIAHSDLAPARKGDPGGRFDWARLARSRLSIWPDAVSGEMIDPKVFRDAAIGFGYPQDCSAEHLLSAFRLRFRPWAIGPLEARDVAVIQNLALRFPVDASVPTS